MDGDIVKLYYVMHVMKMFWWKIIEFTIIFYLSIWLYMCIVSSRIVFSLTLINNNISTLFYLNNILITARIVFGSLRFVFHMIIDSFSKVL